jgi:hypothetical protein
MPPIGDKDKVRKFMDDVETPLTVSQRRGPRGELELEIVIEPTDDLVPVVEAAREAGFVLSYDGQQIRAHAPGGPTLPVETTPVPEEVTSTE